MWTAVLIALMSAGLAVDMEPGALRRRLDDIYLHRRERGSILSAVHEHVSPNLAETQPMSVEICFRLNIWPLQQLSALPEFHFLFNMDPRGASVDLLYQEHLLQWMTVGDLLGDLVGRMETHHGRTLWQKKHLHRSGRSSPIRGS